jgi:undecaprenyl-diphosphatase
MKFNTRIKRITGFGLLSLLLSFILDNDILYLVVLLQSSSVIEFFSYVTFLGEALSIFFLSVLLSVFLFRYKKKLLPLWATLITVFGVIVILKLFIMRPRPFEMMQTASIVRTRLSSVPSGHAMAIFSLVPFASMLWEKYSYGFWIIALLVAFSRIYLQVHYLSDVVAGSVIGYIIAKVYMYVGDKHGWK